MIALRDVPAVTDGVVSFVRQPENVPVRVGRAGLIHSDDLRLADRDVPAAKAGFDQLRSRGPLEVELESRCLLETDDARQVLERDVDRVDLERDVEGVPYVHSLRGGHVDPHRILRGDVHRPALAGEAGRGDVAGGVERGGRPGRLSGGHRRDRGYAESDDGGGKPREYAAHEFLECSEGAPGGAGRLSSCYANYIGDSQSCKRAEVLFRATRAGITRRSRRVDLLVERRHPPVHRPVSLVVSVHGAQSDRPKRFPVP